MCIHLLIYSYTHEVINIHIYTVLTNLKFKLKYKHTDMDIHIKIYTQIKEDVK